MKFPLSFLIALRFFCKKNCNKKISSVSNIFIFSISLGTIIFLVGLSVIQGFEHELKYRILSIIPHGEITSPNLSMNIYNNIKKKLENSKISCSMSPYLSSFCLLKTMYQTKVIKMQGINFSSKKMSGILTYTYYLENKFSFSSGKKRVFIGKKLASECNVQIGDWINIFLYVYNKYEKIFQIKKISLNICGIFFTNTKIDCDLILVPLSDAQNYLQRNKEDIDGVFFSIKNAFNIKEFIQKNIKPIINSKFIIQDWVEKYNSLFKDIQIIRHILYFTMTLIIGIIFLGNISILLIFLKEKEIDITIFGFLGIHIGIIRKIFFWYNFIIIVLGNVIGTFISILISKKINFLIEFLEKSLQCKIIPNYVYFINFLPVALKASNILKVLILITIVNFLIIFLFSKKFISCSPTNIFKKI